MGAYSRWGLSGDPFVTTALSGDEVGSKLLIGRDREVNVIGNRLDFPNKVIAVEGPQGVGKTSIINVAVYRKSSQTTDSAKLFLPCGQSFQLSQDTNAESFTENVRYQIALSLVRYVDMHPNHSDWFRGLDEIRKWINDTNPRSLSIGGSLAGLVNVSSGQSTNTTAGYIAVGFQSKLHDTLNSVWRHDDGGGVVCVIDNLELVESSVSARKLLEALRDTAFAIPHTRWITSGSLGIVLGAVNSQRLYGYFHAPLEVGPVPGDPLQILRSRIEAVSVRGKAPYLPIREDDFVEIFKTVRGNTRLLLTWAGQYCTWCYENDFTPLTEADKQERFIEWRKSCADRVMHTLDKELTPRAWEVFDKAVAIGGVFSPSQHADFDCNSAQALNPYVRALASVNLIVAKTDEDDNRRKTIHLTDQAWFIAAERSASKKQSK